MTIEQEVIRSIDLERALSQLTSEQRTVIELHYLQDELTCRKIATRLNWPKSMPKKRIYEALCTIRTIWGVRLPERSAKTKAAGAESDSWWPLLLESMYRHEKGSKLPAVGCEVFLRAPSCGVDSAAGIESRQ